MYFEDNYKNYRHNKSIVTKIRIESGYFFSSENNKFFTRCLKIIKVSSFSVRKLSNLAIFRCFNKYHKPKEYYMQNINHSMHSYLSKETIWISINFSSLFKLSSSMHSMFRSTLIYALPTQISAVCAFLNSILLTSVYSCD